MFLSFLFLTIKKIIFKPKRYILVWQVCTPKTSISISILISVFPGGAMLKNTPASAGDKGNMGFNPGSEKSPEKEMATHSSILASKMPRTDKPGGLHSIGLQSQTQLSSWARPLLFVLAFSQLLFLHLILLLSNMQRSMYSVCCVESEVRRSMDYFYFNSNHVWWFIIF